ncbi:MAG: DUF4435 domain-containing protein, partial [Spirochaetes bacterium]|nr:DUF4435 domain-containing protein [Spirochaetota bacterium]
MDNFKYSSDAQSVKSMFYGKDFSVFVEGDEDINFWAMYFQMASNKQAYIEQVGGKEELQDKIDMIINEDAKIIVAMDKDHTPFLNDEIINKKIIKTVGYSIENTLYCPFSLDSITKIYCRNQLEYYNKYNQWLDDFANDAMPLLI